MKPNQDKSLEDILAEIEAKEAAKTAGLRINQTGAYAVCNTSQQQNQLMNTTCFYCGKKGHGKNSSWRLRKKVCSAYNQRCEFCKKKHHLENVCLSKNKPMAKCDKNATLGEGSGAVFTELCNISAHQAQPKILDHHLYDHQNGTWKQQASQPHPYVRVKIKAKQKDYQDLGFKLKGNILPITEKAMADTGCQNCLIGDKIIERMGIQRKDLIPAKMKMHAANNKAINILGAAILRFSGTDESQGIIQTRQIVYVISGSNSIYLSREACKDLGMISNSFPTIRKPSH